jgi:hypothetical protein
MTINNIEYVRADTQHAKDDKQRPFVIIRSHGAGVFAGYLSEENDKEQTVVLDGCIRLWRWTGCSLSQVANDGIAGTGENKFGMPTQGHKILGVIEIIPCTEKARTVIEAVKKWKM